MRRSGDGVGVTTATLLLLLVLEQPRDSFTVDVAKKDDKDGGPLCVAGLWADDDNEDDDDEEEDANGAGPGSARPSR